MNVCMLDRKNCLSELCRLVGWTYMGSQNTPTAVWWTAGTGAQCGRSPGIATISSQMLCRACHDVLQHQVRSFGKEADLALLTFIYVRSSLSQGAFAVHCMLLVSC